MDEPLVGISVIVPTLNEASLIESTLRSVLAGAPPDLELIVVDGGSTDGTPELVAAVDDPRVRLLTSPPGRAVQMNAGAGRATGHVLLFLHGDTRLLSGSLAAMVETLSAPGVVAGHFRLRFDRPHPLLRFYSWCTTLPVSIFHYGDQGIFVRRGTFERLGGYPDLSLLEDVALLRRLRALGRVVKASAGGVVTSARRFERGGIVRQQLRNGLLLMGHHLGVSPARLKRSYDDTLR